MERGMHHCAAARLYSTFILNSYHGCLLGCMLQVYFGPHYEPNIGIVEDPTPNPPAPDRNPNPIPKVPYPNVYPDPNTNPDPNPNQFRCRSCSELSIKS